MNISFFAFLKDRPDDSGRFFFVVFKRKREKENRLSWERLSLFARE